MLGAVAVVALFIHLSEADVNYCGASMCGKSNTHTFCQFIPGPGPICSGYIDDRLTGEEKGRVIARMNRRRSEAAQGSLQQLPSASNMLKLRWVEELAREAQMWADQCSPPGDPEHHDECRDLYAITVGQCIASVVGEAPGLRPESMVDMWYLQGRQYKGSIMIPTNNKDSPMDFAQMLWAETYLVGCARSRFMTEFEGRSRTVTRLVCNFAPRGPYGPLWRPGAPASDCPPRSRPDPVLYGLCTFHHEAVFNYDITNTTVLKEQSLLDTILEIEQNSSLEFHGSLDQMYIRKMIVSNMSQQSTNESNQQHSTEKSDIDKPKILEDKDTSVNVTDNYQSVIDDVIAQMIEKSSTERVTKKIFSTIGRPQAYNIEELNSSIKDFKNGTTGPDDIVKEDDYNDYEFDVNIEKNGPDYLTSGSNVTMSIIETFGTGNATDIAATTKSPANVVISFETTYPNTTQMNKGTQNTGIEDGTATPFVQNDMLKRLLELSEKAEQNPNDPETARELNEALLRMEEALETPPSKVRRELRSNEYDEVPDARQYKQGPKNEEPTEKAREQEMKEIGNLDTAPILNIITKYAPFLKSYGTMFQRNGATITSVNIVLLVLCVVFNCL